MRLFRTLSSSLLLLLLSCSTLAAQSFRPIPGISFTKVYGAANPLAQHVPVTSAGSDFRFHTVVTASTGGNWLSVSAYDEYYGNTTPHVLVVSATPAADLAVGIYTAQITLTSSSSGSIVLNIPVTLTVTSPATPSFDNLPGQLSFFIKTSGANPTAKTLDIRNAGGGTLNWTGNVSTSDSGAWLQLSSTSGAAPARPTVSVNKANLPGSGLVAGTFTGLVTLQASGNSVTIPVSVIVGSNVFSQTDELQFTKAYGGAVPLPQMLMVASTGSDFAFYTSASTANGGDWLTIASYDAYYGNSTPHVVYVSVNPAANLAAGTYTGQVVVRATTGQMAMVIPVSLTIQAPSTAVFDTLPGQLSYFMKLNGPNPNTKTVEIRNAGTGTLPWSATVSTSDGGAWLRVNQANGTARSDIEISVDKANLPGSGLVAGTFTGSILLRSTAGGAVTMPVTVVVSNRTFNQIDGIQFTKVYGGNNPLLQILPITSNGQDFRFYTAYWYSAGGNWLKPLDFDSYYGNDTPRMLTVSVDPAANLAVGTYTGQIVLVTSNATASMTIPVTLTIVSPQQPSFDNLPGHLSFFLQPGGSNPAAKSLHIRNGGAGSLNWTATRYTSDGGNWLHVSPGSGTARSTVHVSVQSANLPGNGLVAGTFTGSVLLESAGASVSVPVTVVVGESVFNSIEGLSFSKTYGGANPLPQTITISSTGTNFTFYTSRWTSTGGDWLTVTGFDSYYGNTTPRALTVSVNPAANLARGTYTGQILLYRSNGALAMTVPVSLVVGPTLAEALQFVPVTPCRVADTRTPSGPFGGTIAAGTSRAIPVSSSACGIPSAARAFSVNVTVVPQGILGYVTAYPTGEDLPLASTLNSLDGRVKANAAIVPAAAGSVSIFASHTTDVILDINGYFIEPNSNTLAFYPLTPCRVADTRNNPGALGGPRLTGGAERSFPIRASACNIPATAQAYSLNFTAVPQGPLGYITTWPEGGSRPVVSTLNAPTGAVTANAAIIPAGTGGSVRVFATNDTDLVIDINGYFAPPAANGLSLYNVRPCRVIDTREPAGTPAQNGVRNVNVQGSQCQPPATSRAYVFGATVVPSGLLGYLTLWPQAQAQPLASNLNALDAAVTSNMAIVPTTNGYISAYASHNTYLILDTSGYFAP